MDKTLLVAAEVAAGSRLLEALDHSDLTIEVALWLNLAEYDDWRLLLASRRLDAANPTGAYGLVHDAFEREGILLEHTPTLLILKMTDPFIKDLRRTFGKTKNVEGMRLGGQMFGDRFVQDGLVLRIR